MFNNGMVQDWLRVFSIFFLVGMGTLSNAQGAYVPPKIPEKTQKKFEELVLASKGGHSEEVIPELNEIIAKYPTWTEPRHELSRIYYEASNFRMAVTTLEKSIAIDTASQVKQL